METPYFKFYPKEWLVGDINFMDLDVQGAFVLVCCHYWLRDSITLQELLRRCGAQSAPMIEGLVKGGMISVDSKNQNISIKFLEEQKKRLDAERKKIVEGGREGAAKRWSAAAPAKPNPEIDLPAGSAEQENQPPAPPAPKQPKEGRSNPDGYAKMPDEPEALAIWQKLPPHKRIYYDFQSYQWVGITEKDVSDWRAAYPAVNVVQKLNALDIWIRSAGARGKKKNFAKFITDRMSIDQDRGGSR